MEKCKECNDVEWRVIVAPCLCHAKSYLESLKIKLGVFRVFGGSAFSVLASRVRVSDPRGLDSAGVGLQWPVSLESTHFLTIFP